LTFSAAGQAAAVGAVVLVSLAHTDALPRSLFTTTIGVPGKRPEPVQQTAQQPVARTVRSSPHIFTMPARVPATISLAASEPGPAPEAASGGGDLAVIGGLGTGFGLSSTLINAISRPTPPAPRIETPAPSKPAAPSKPIPVSTGVQSAKLIRQVNPVYPALARQARISGTVRLMAIIGRDGAIQNLQVASGHPLLVPAAVEAVKQWRYHPTLLNDEPVEVITQIDVNFTLTP
jgi:protein TonB